MKQIFMASLLLVLSFARKPSDQQELSAAPDVGFTAENLAQIEASILGLAQEGATQDNTTLEALATIFDLMRNLTEDVLQRAYASQLGVNQSYEKLVGCRLNLTNAQTSRNLTILNNTHRECAVEESTLAASYVTCTSNCASRCSTAQASCGLYCPVNIPQPMPGQPVPLPSPTPSPTDCWYDTEKVKKDDEIGFYHEWEANLYYKKWEDNFQTLYDDWKSKRDNCHDRVSELNNCYTSCSNAQGSTYEAKKQECTEHQYDLENAACPDDSQECLGYRECHEFLTTVYVDDVAAANASQAVWYVQYKGIMRVVCLLNAFKSSITTGASLSSALDACQARTFEPCTEAPSLCLDLYPVPQAEFCNGTFAGDNTSLQPGSAEWITTYYSNMPNKTSYESCGAKCCAPGPSTTTTTTSTTLVPSSNCSLCCNTTDSWCKRA